MRLLSGRNLCWWLAAMLPLVFLLGLLAGPTFIPFSALFGLEGASENGSYDALILRELRLPRAIMSGLIGAVLAMSGAVLQGLFRNPMADPSLIGVTAGASAGASFTILVGAQLSALIGFGALGSLSLVTLGAFVGGMLAVILVYRIATDPVNGTSVSTMLLVGIAVMSLASALQNLMSFLADSELLRRMSLWQMGNLDLANWTRVQICLPMILLFVILLRGQASHLNALLLGESEARHLGVDVDSMKKRLIFLTALGVGVATALAGSIAFIGLIVPHLVRLLSGPDHRSLILASGLLGAILLILADVLARILMAPAELPVGMITAFLGVPFFLFLLRRQLRVQ